MAVVAEKHILARTMSYQFDRKIGVEWEAFVCDLRGRPLDVPALLAASTHKENGFETITREVAPNQIEMVTNPYLEAGDLLSALRQLERMTLRLNGGDVRLQCLPRLRNPSGGILKTAFNTSRQRAVLSALSHADEGGDDWHYVYEMAKVCATHYHFDFADSFVGDAVNACNLLTVATPDILDWVNSEFDLPFGDRTRAWTRFARAERLPAPRWFRDFEAYKCLFESIPRLARGLDKEGDGWVVDMKTRQVFGDPAAEGTTWWGVRLRPKFYTVEYRYLPTMHKPEQIVECAIVIDEWLTRALHHLGESTYSNLTEALSHNAVLPFKGRAVVRDEYEWWQRMNRF